MKDFEALFASALNHQINGDADLAIEAYNDLIAFQPNNAELYYNRANAYSEALDVENALNDYANAILLNPAFADAYFNRGLLHLAAANHNVVQDIPSFQHLTAAHNLCAQHHTLFQAVRAVAQIWQDLLPFQVMDFGEETKPPQVDPQDGHAHRGAQVGRA